MGAARRMKKERKEAKVGGATMAAAITTATTEALKETATEMEEEAEAETTAAADPRGMEIINTGSTAAANAAFRSKRWW